MLVSVTGGTGFVGAHSVAALVRRGHRVRLLVRDEGKAERALAPLGVDLGAVETAVGDVTDAAAVDGAVRGADALLHAASVYSFDSRRRAEMRRVNERGTEVVLDAARRHGVGQIVHVSTFGALAPGPGSTVLQPPPTAIQRTSSARRIVGVDAPVGRPREPYTATKAAAERIARGHQAAGVPVTITYPPALLGPHDPNLGDQTARLRNALRGLMPMWPTGGFPVGDVRDTAQFHADLFDGGPGGRGRHHTPGRYLSTRQYVAALREVTGRRLPAVFLPARMMLPVGLLTDVLQRVWPWHIPAEYGAVHICAADLRPAGAPEPRPVDETFRDAVRWLRGTGLLTAGQAGLAGRTGPPGGGGLPGDERELRREGR
ncbi:NAD-dependent epimerase/dehydratase family protein [Actinomadura sp. KC06]|uniref:NAD-dependent epimerase/dehydratase family protein n=1 Tax=Actinomadura sp. KC06 TaxID=2530369 RepID=UPI00104D9B83|nr:NAD-dependent epimerase/dehydratase family protein [Actinomadura sp. KC06]TDD35502.1 NAD-dependent epimerase/dehydratase family protein [Actinomadura sp. KC06]